ncbi:unnamed protein product [Durusdinium trenchii]|uniref:Uncharacterized protein n=2 Tax=Durusdinium trenchii TaxID=1381693 RepID=A0ABP0NE96_9DINO
MRQLKHHEQKLLKKVNFYDWKSTRNVRESSILRKYQIEDREDYTKYQKLALLIQKLTSGLRKLKSSDEDRIKMTEILLDKMYSLGLIQNTQSLEDSHELPASTFCRRRLPVVLVRMKLCQDLPQAIKYIKQGEIRIGPDVVTNPALHVTREMEDHITWAEGSKMRRQIKEFSNEADDFELLGN